jgi:hypothetical protein
MSPKSQRPVADPRELCLQRRWLPARMLAGAGSGLLIYLLFLSGLATGDLFPDLRTLSVTEPVPLATGLEVVAKLVLWSVIGGFSERLIPSVLTRVEHEAMSHARTPAPVDDEPPSGGERGPGTGAGRT